MNIILKIGYIGTNYHGFSQQKTNCLTIENIFKKILLKLYGYNINIISASRTDAGVHAAFQMIQYCCNNIIPEHKISYVLNNLLPWDIRVYEAYKSNKNFHVRYNCLKKTYNYIIDNKKNPSVYLLPFSFHIPIELNIENMIYSLNQLKGTHDFQAFCAKNSYYNNFERIIYSTSINKNKKGILIFKITGNGFLYKMIRIIVGTLIGIGMNIIEKNIFLESFKYKKREILGKTAPSKGLILKKIIYKNGLLIKINK